MRRVPPVCPDDSDDETLCILCTATRRWRTSTGNGRWRRGEREQGSSGHRDTQRVDPVRSPVTAEGGGLADRGHSGSTLDQHAGDSLGDSTANAAQTDSQTTVRSLLLGRSWRLLPDGLEAV